MAKRTKQHVCNPPALTRSSPWVDIVRWTCPVCWRVHERRFEVR